jgi:HEAT repeat protein
MHPTRGATITISEASLFMCRAVEHVTFQRAAERSSRLGRGGGGSAMRHGLSICYGAAVSFLFPSTEITFEAALRDIASSNSKARAAAAHALGDVTDPVEKRRASDALVRALDDDSPQVRMEACASLGDLGEAGTLTHLVKRLADGAAPVRQNAAIALGTIRHPDGFEPLAEALRDGPADLRFQAATSLAEIDPVRAFAPVLLALDV